MRMARSPHGISCTSTNGSTAAIARPYAPVATVAGAVGQARGVGEVQVVLGRKPDQQLVEHRQAADAGVEDADGAAAEVVWGRGGHGRAESGSRDDDGGGRVGAGTKSTAAG